MEQLVNILMVLIFVAAAVYRVKKGAKNARQSFSQKQGDRTDFLSGNSPILPQTQASGAENKNLDTLVSVYGPGAQISLDDVSVLLGISESAAQECLDALERQGRAAKTYNASGKIRYRIK